MFYPEKVTIYLKNYDNCTSLTVTLEFDEVPTITIANDDANVTHIPYDQLLKVQEDMNKLCQHLWPGDKPHYIF